MLFTEDIRFMTPLTDQVLDGATTYTYRGWYKVNSPQFANAATADQKGEAKFKICRITTLNGESTTEWADGNFNYDNVWDDRATLTYSFIKN